MDRSEGEEGEEESASICTEINKAASGITCNTTLIIGNPTISQIFEFLTAFGDSLSLIEKRLTVFS